MFENSWKIECKSLHVQQSDITSLSPRNEIIFSNSSGGRFSNILCCKLQEFKSADVYFMSSRVLSGGEEDDIPDITLYLSSGTKFVCLSLIIYYGDRQTPIFWRFRSHEQSYNEDLWSTKILMIFFEVLKFLLLKPLFEIVLKWQDLL